MKRTILPLNHSMNRAFCRRALLLIPLALSCFTVSPPARAVTPPPDGGYPNQNTAEGEDALFDVTFGLNDTAIGYHALYGDTTGNYNTATGSLALESDTTGSTNTAIGYGALASNTTAHNNTASGGDALNHNTTGANNTAEGAFALYSNTVGTSNVAVGFDALFYNTSGDTNIAVGATAGMKVITGSNNIEIGHPGVPGDHNKIRIGKEQTATFIAGIFNATSTGGVPVFINSAGQLGTTTSSARFKEAIEPMDKKSESILALKPVTFRYKHDLGPEDIPQFGLVAEEVEKVNPDLVARDQQGKPSTVRYEAVNAMLLNEFLKEHKAFVEEQRTVQEQGAMIERLQKQVEALTAGRQK